MFDVHALREQFPALRRPAVFLDGPGGTQVPRRVVDAMVHYLTTCNANTHGPFATSRESDAVLRQAHEAAADLLNAPSPDEVVFGPNMTTLTFHLSRSISRTLRPGDEVLVTRMDHDANVSPWVLAARDAGAVARFVDLRTEDCTLDLDDLRRQLGPRTRLVAVTCASNAVGTVNDVAAIARWAHDAGARGTGAPCPGRGRAVAAVPASHPVAGHRLRPGRRRARRPRPAGRSRPRPGRTAARPPRRARHRVAWPRGRRLARRPGRPAAAARRAAGGGRRGREASPRRRLSHPP